MKLLLLTLAVVTLGGGLRTAMAQAGPYPERRFVPATRVRVQDEFWRPRLDAQRHRTLPHCLAVLEEKSWLANYRRAAGLSEGAFEGKFYRDSDVYKVIEGAAYTLSLFPNRRLEEQVDAIIDHIAAAQQSDGYLNTYYTLVEPDNRWTNLAVMHELYCAGHLFEAAVAYSRATGKRKLLDVAERFADHIDGIFGPDKRMGYPGHQEIELALVRLYDETGETRYRDLAAYFIDVRGREPLEHADHPVYLQAHKPVREQHEAAGHAVRATYLYAGMTDVADLTGDAGYLNALDHLWRDVVHRKMYITGGVGARRAGEAFGEPYELPNGTAYAETCAAIGLAMWNQRLWRMHGDAKYMDVFERALYNGILSGISLEGDEFFYVNPLASDGGHRRQSWYDTACCPTNLVRFIPTIGGHVYGHNDGTLWVNLYVAGTGRITIGGGIVDITQETYYPWDGDVGITLSPPGEMDFELKLRVPGWCEAPAVRINGDDVRDLATDRGYITLKRKWAPGDRIDLRLPMPVRRIAAHPQVRDNVGRVALQRGPLVYCLEAVDHQVPLSRLVLPREATFEEYYDPDVAGGVIVVTAQGLALPAEGWGEGLYGPPPSPAPARITAIPYHVWAHREPGAMMVWIPEWYGGF